MKYYDFHFEETVSEMQVTRYIRLAAPTGIFEAIENFKKLYDPKQFNVTMILTVPNP